MPAAPILPSPAPVFVVILATLRSLAIFRFSNGVLFERCFIMVYRSSRPAFQSVTLFACECRPRRRADQRESTTDDD